MIISYGGAKTNLHPLHLIVATGLTLARSRQTLITQELYFPRLPNESSLRHLSQLTPKLNEVCWTLLLPRPTLLH